MTHDDDEHEWGCCFPGECCMPGDHMKSECHTAEMIEGYENEMREESARRMAERKAEQNEQPNPYEFDFGRLMHGQGGDPGLME